MVRMMALAQGMVTVTVQVVGMRVTAQVRAIQVQERVIQILTVIVILKIRIIWNVWNSVIHRISLICKAMQIVRLLNMRLQRSDIRQNCKKRLPI